MKSTYIILTILVVIISNNATMADTHSKSRKHSSNIYRMALIDVEDEGHFTKEGRKNNGDVAHLRGFIWVELNDRGIKSALNDEDVKKSDLHVICRFKHGFGKPMITLEAQILVRYIKQCSIKIIDRKTNKVLLNKLYVRNGDKVSDFIKSSFAEWRKK